jgi:hypothetical protein
VLDEVAMSDQACSDGESRPDISMSFWGRRSSDGLQVDYGDPRGSAGRVGDPYGNKFGVWRH